MGSLSGIGGSQSTYDGVENHTYSAKSFVSVNFANTWMHRIISTRIGSVIPTIKVQGSNSAGQMHQSTKQVLSPYSYVNLLELTGREDT